MHISAYIGRQVSDAAAGVVWPVFMSLLHPWLVVPALVLLGCPSKHGSITEKPVEEAATEGRAGISIRCGQLRAEWKPERGSDDQSRTGAWLFWRGEVLLHTSGTEDEAVGGPFSPLRDGRASSADAARR
jgi:hypothetical protein